MRGIAYWICKVLDYMDPDKRESIVLKVNTKNPPSLRQPYVRLKTFGSTGIGS